MAEILLSGVLRKLAGFTVEKVLELCGVNEAIAKLVSLKEISVEVENLNKELSWIRAFIKDADKRRIVDETHKKWLTDLIEIAYQIEDALDIFFLECPTARRNPLQKFFGLGKKTLQLKFFYEFHEKLKKIGKDISWIDEHRKMYEIKSLGVDIKGQNTQSDWGHKLDPIGDPEIVGFAEDVEKIVKNLCDKNIKRLAVVSIVGPGGLGKTTLAQKVRYSEKVWEEFGQPAWVTISQTYDMFGIVRKIANCFDIKFSADSDMDGLACKIREHLTKKKYLIILDDVWTKELCDKLLRNGILPNTDNGSRVLITTRLVTDVARYADSTFEPYEPEVLIDSDSRELFLKNAIPQIHHNSEGLSPNLNELAEKFLKKCRGLPLALVVLGRLLSTMPCDYHEWKQLLDTMSWHDDEIDEYCSKIVATSFEHLPYARKFCFMYFAAYPEDHKIKVKPLLRMWIAEGLIPQEDRRTLEQTAERILEDLVQRSMVQVYSRDEVDGSIESLCVHDILRDLAVEKAKENNFLAVCSKQADWNLEHCRKARRVAVHYSNFNEHIQQYASSNLRSLLIFGCESSLDCSKFRLLRVLAESDTDIGVVGQVQVQSFKGLSHLRYLQLDDPIDNKHERVWNFEAQTLETVHCLGLSCNISRDIWKIKTLRHVSPESFIDGPPASANLPNLQTLTNVTSCPTWRTSQLPKIFGVRELGISVNRDSLDVIAALLGKLNHLVFLNMCGDILIQKFEGVFPFLEKLKTLELSNGRYAIPTAQELKDDMLPPNLISLSLYGFEFKSDPMPVLEKLGSLKFLYIINSNSKYPLKISCSAGGFKHLEKFALAKVELLQEWKIELGAMPLLEHLHVRDCYQLPVPQPNWFIDHKSLQLLEWRVDSKTTDLQEANKNKLSEISNARPNLGLVH